jgi:hypothetical protein
MEGSAQGGASQARPLVSTKALGAAAVSAVAAGLAIGATDADAHAPYTVT